MRKIPAISYPIEYQSSVLSILANDLPSFVVNKSLLFYAVNLELKLFDAFKFAL